MRWLAAAMVVTGCGGPVVLETGFERDLVQGGPCGTDAYVALDDGETVRLQVELPSSAASFPIEPPAGGYFRVYTGHRLTVRSGELCVDLAGDRRPSVDYVYDAVGGAAEIVGEEGKQVVAVQGLVLRADNQLLDDGVGQDDWKDLEEVRLQDFTFPEL